MNTNHQAAIVKRVIICFQELVFLSNVKKRKAKFGRFPATQSQASAENLLNPVKARVLSDNLIRFLKKTKKTSDFHKGTRPVQNVIH